MSGQSSAVGILEDTLLPSFVISHKNCNKADEGINLISFADTALYQDVKGQAGDAFRWGKVEVPAEHGKVVQVSAGLPQCVVYLLPHKFVPWELGT